jgi:hypothetical protein
MFDYSQFLFHTVKFIKQILLEKVKKLRINAIIKIINAINYFYFITTLKFKIIVKANLFGSCKLCISTSCKYLWRAKIPEYKMTTP